MEYFSAYLSSELKRIQALPILKIGLNVKTPYDGRKHGPNDTTPRRNRIMAVHIDAEGALKKVDMLNIY